MSRKISSYEIEQKIEQNIEKLVDVKAAERAIDFLIEGSAKEVFTLLKKKLGKLNSALLVADLYCAAIRDGALKPSHSGKILKGTKFVVDEYCSAIYIDDGFDHSNDENHEDNYIELAGPKYS